MQEPPTLIEISSTNGTPMLSLNTNEKPQPPTESKELTSSDKESLVSNKTPSKDELPNIEITEKS